LAAARERAAEIEHVRAQLDIAAHVQQLFFRALIAQQKLHAATVTLAARKTQLADAERAAAQGVMLLADAARVRANVRSAEYSMVVAGNEVDDLESELSDALDIENGAPLELVAPDARPTPLRPIAEYVNVARAMSPEVARARIAVEEAKRALSLARADYIPETGVGVTHTYQKGVAFLPQHSTALTIQGSWTIWDFGKRSASMRERRASLAIAKLSLERAEDQVTTAVEKAYRRANRASVAAAAAQAALDASRSALRIASDKEKQGIVLAAHRADAEATEVASRMELLSAFLEERIAGVELSRVAGVPAALASRWK
jgi:outer membrane protein TolC